MNIPVLSSVLNVVSSAETKVADLMLSLSAAINRMDGRFARIAATFTVGTASFAVLGVARGAIAVVGHAVGVVHDFVALHIITVKA